MKNDHIDLLYITNNPRVAVVAEKAGIDYLFIDLEQRGKVERQFGRDTVISNHTFLDIKIIKSYLSKSKLLVRINPFFEGTADEVEMAIKNGADALMLPMFESRYEVENFIKLVDKRAEVFLLLETKKSFDNLEDILSVTGIDRIHVGLNDLHIQMNKTFMFELFIDGTIQTIINLIKSKRPDIRYGFGGVGRIGEGLLPASNILAYHYEMDSSSVILSRSFCDVSKINEVDIDYIITKGVEDIRRYYQSLTSKDLLFFENNKKEMKVLIEKIVGRENVQ